jgi:hypothetical protein
MVSHKVLVISNVHVHGEVIKIHGIHGFTNRTRFRLGTISSSDIVEIHGKKPCGGDLVLTPKRGLGNMPIRDDFFQEAIRGLKKFNTDQQK